MTRSRINLQERTLDVLNAILPNPDSQQAAHKELYGRCDGSSSSTRRMETAGMLWPDRREDKRDRSPAQNENIDILIAHYTGLNISRLGAYVLAVSISSGKSMSVRNHDYRRSLAVNPHSPLTISIMIVHVSWTTTRSAFADWSPITPTSPMWDHYSR
ncbi:uncharacterized protein BT62DRAFT_999338 [Guyanagaster necrorhizus]|uniref:Uncharacterized protein n=1 Tax=Guyanagaster necrorhizus TaxID=856835 RepID=A0A9P7W5Z6_9AGAR|nr:uncharacterized protein BT62DRAFT_999338 [Guyanagaster necrorhizus MCA 3950]KAG7453283.1 hypothetical protein BT62DRAFT_999338 [Guyanagaster necrorhizus MCA 3950]